MRESLVVVVLLQPDVVLYHNKDTFQLINQDARQSTSKRHIIFSKGAKQELVSTRQGAITNLVFNVMGAIPLQKTI